MVGPCAGGNEVLGYVRFCKFSSSRATGGLSRRTQFHGIIKLRAMDSYRPPTIVRVVKSCIICRSEEDENRTLCAMIQYLLSYVGLSFIMLHWK